MKILQKEVCGIKYAIPEERLKIFFSRLKLTKLDNEITRIEFISENGIVGCDIVVSIKKCIEWAQDYDERILSKMKEAGYDVIEAIIAIQVPRVFQYEPTKKPFWRRIFN